jgi:hypothetical protein
VSWGGAQSNYPPLTGLTADTDQVLTCPGCTRLQIQISNQPVLITFGHGVPGAIQWEPNAEPYLPVTGTLNRDFDAFKVRSMNPGNPATVYLTPK